MDTGVAVGCGVGVAAGVIRSKSPPFPPQPTSNVAIATVAASQIAPRVKDNLIVFILFPIVLTL